MAHVEQLLDDTFDTATKAGLLLRLSKAQFDPSIVKYLGYYIPREGIQSENTGFKP